MLLTCRNDSRIFALHKPLMPYDSSLTMFSPEGNLIQVQYAFKAVSRGTSSVGLVSDKGIVFTVEKKQTARLQDPHTN